MPIPFPIPVQYSILETFSPNTAENINKILTGILGKVDVDLTHDLKINNVVIPAGGGFAVDINLPTISISNGICVIHSVMIQTTETYELNVLNQDSYLYFSEGDTIPSSDGVYSLYLVMKYKPSVNTNLYIGLINNPTFYHNNSEDLIFLGTLLVTFAGGNPASASYTIYDPADPDLMIPFPPDWVDGGWIAVPR